MDGTSVALQQKLMRHSDIGTTLNIYGDVVTDEMSEAKNRVSDKEALYQLSY